MATSNFRWRVMDALLAWSSQIVTDPVLRRKYPNRDFAVTVGQPYLDVSVLPNIIEREGVGFDEPINMEGILSMVVRWPVRDGIVKPAKVADQLTEATKPGTIFSHGGVVVRVYEEPAVRPPVEETDFVSLPVLVRWRASSSEAV